jgi:flavin-dependent dehydrogenase
MERADVVVVGAGPAGTAAAITAAERGLHVVCLDKATFPRDKTCGDGLTANALRLLERLGVPYDAIAPVAVHETVIVSPSGRRAVLPMGRDSSTRRWSRWRAREVSRCARTTMSRRSWSTTITCRSTTSKRGT